MNQTTLSEYQSSDWDCPTCGRTFDTENGMKTHHAQKHGESISGVPANCGYCGNSLRVARRRKQENERVYCDADCRGAYRSENFEAWNKGNREYTEYTCTNCTKPFERDLRRPTPDKPFCSTSCRDEYQSKRPKSEHPEWLGERNQFECDYCGDCFTTPPTETDRRFCSKACWIDYDRANNNFESIATAVRQRLTPGWEKKRSEYRDGKCEMCGGGVEKYDRKHDIHHIVPIKSGGCHATELLMELCRGCHAKAEKFVEQYPEFDPVLVE